MAVKLKPCAVRGYENPWHEGGIDWASNAFLQGISMVSRVALGNGISRVMVAVALHNLADAIDGTVDVAEDTNEIWIPMC